MTRRRSGPATRRPPWLAGDEEACPTCEGQKVLTGSVGRRRERICLSCGERWEAPA